MRIDIPAAVKCPIRECPLRENILFRQTVFRLHPAALPFAGDRADPVERIAVRVKFPAVFHIVPDTKHQPPQLQCNILCVRDRIAQSAVFKPPAIAAAHPFVDDAPAAAKDFLNVRHVVGIVRCNERHGMVFFFCVIKNGVTERFMVSISDRKRNARLCADRSVAGRVDEIVRFNMKLPLATLLHAAQCRDAPPVQLHLVDLCVEQERQIFLAQHRVQKRLVPEDRVRIGIAVEVLELQLAPHAHFLRPEIARAGRAARPDADLTARVPAQNRSVRHQHRLNAVPRRRDRRADARRAAADHRQLCSHRLHDTTCTSIAHTFCSSAFVRYPQIMTSKIVRFYYQISFFLRYFLSLCLS